MAKTLIHELLEFFPTPVDDWAWFQVPNTGIALSFPRAWRIEMALDRKDWFGKASSGIMSERGGPLIRGIIKYVPGGPKNVKKHFHFLCKEIENDMHLTIHRKFRDRQIQMLNYGYEISYDAGAPEIEWTVRMQYIAFINTGYILTLRGVSASSHWESERHIFDKSFEKLVIFEPKEFFSNN